MGRRAFENGVPLCASPFVNALQHREWVRGWELAEADDIALAEGWPLGDTPVPGH